VSFIKKHKYDLLVILAALVLSFAVLACVRLTRAPGAEVVITIDGEIYMRRSLDEKDVTIEIVDDGRKNTVVIKHGAVCVSEASCPDHVCVNSGWKKYDGETIVCLPNKLVVTVVGGEDGGLDAVTG